MNLLFWRHAEAEDGPPDLQRELTARGRQQAKKTAGWLDKTFPNDGRILVSPAVRTRQTADALGRDYEIEPGIAPGTPSRSVLKAIGVADGVPGGRDKHLLVVGHQPWIGQCLRLLLTGEADDWSVRKAAVWWLAYRDRGGDGEWTLRAIVDPALIERD